MPRLKKKGKGSGEDAHRQANERKAGNKRESRARLALARRNETDGPGADSGDEGESAGPAEPASPRPGQQGRRDQGGLDKANLA